MAGRTDAALLTVPVLTPDYYSHDFLLLDSNTPVITAHDASGGYYIYVYAFLG